LLNFLRSTTIFQDEKKLFNLGFTEIFRKGIFGDGRKTKAVIKKLEKGFHPGEDKFSRVHLNTDWKISLNYAKKIGLGTQNYDLMVVD
jgi:hypothetical protein